ncbi:MAG TPA: hypothetical protein VJI67_04295, partial [archaeon]|nr:hypothetical protein [archaeon]
FGVLSIAVYTYEIFKQRGVENSARAVTEEIANAARATVLGPGSQDLQDVTLKSVLGTKDNFRRYALKVFARSASGPANPNGVAVFCLFSESEANLLPSPTTKPRAWSCGSVEYKGMTVKVFDKGGNSLPYTSQPLETQNPPAILPFDNEKLVLYKEMDCSKVIPSCCNSGTCSPGTDCVACVPRLCIISCTLVGYDTCKNSVIEKNITKTLPGGATVTISKCLQ